MADENKSAMDEFLGDLKNDGQADPFTQNPDDPFASITPKEEEGTKTEDGKTDEKPVEKSLPFHKDPKVQRYIEREIAKRIPTERPVSEAPRESLKSYAEILAPLIGNDAPEKRAVLDEMARAMSEREERITQLAWERSQEEQQAEIQAEQEAEDQLLTGFEDIEENYNIDITSSTPQARKMRGEFINFIRKVAPKDEYGEIVDYPDLVETFDAFKSTRQTTNQSARARELASRSSERGSSTPAPATQNQPLSWDSPMWEKIKDSLTGR